MKKKIFMVAAAIAASCAVANVPTVVTPDSPTAVEMSAAKELAGELGKCLEKKIEIVSESAARDGVGLFVGATKAAKAARSGADGTGCRPYQVDEVFLKSVDGGVVMDGDPARAPLYAVDLYLEKYCGVRWWTSDAATYPKLDAAPVKDISLSYAPQFKFRETYYLDGFDPLFKVRSKGNFTSLTRYLLTDTDTKVIAIASQTGFCNAPYLIRSFKKVFGASPSVWRRREAATRKGRAGF